MSNKKHTPAFRWKDNCVYDHDEQIASFFSDPEGKQHISLDAVKLIPGGDPLLHWTLSWRQGGICSTAKLQSLDVRNPGADKLQIEFKADTLDGSFTSETLIELAYDTNRNCYRYETETSLQVNKFPFYSWKEIDSAQYGEFMGRFPEEFANFLPGPSYSYYAPVDPVPKKWQDFVYQNGAGGWSRVPQHHLHTPDKYNIRFPPGNCKLGFVNDPVGNPCIELIERVPSTSRGAICWALNDIHMLVDKLGVNNLNRYRVKYALRQFTPEETAEIVSQAKGYAYTQEEWDAYDRPCFRHDGGSNFSCDFERGYDLKKPDDNFRFWLAMGEVKYASWARGEGRGGGRCLKQETPAPARVIWQVESTNAPVVRAGKRYRVSAWIKTKDLDGKAYLEAWASDCKSPHKPIPAAICRSREIAKTADWQEVAVEVDAADGIRLADEIRGKMFIAKICVRLVHEGKGASWFDDVSIREIG